MLKFPSLAEALFIERLNRFAVLVNMGGKEEVAHLHDPGRLQELLIPGARLYLQKASNPDRKTGWDIIIVRTGSQLIVIYSIISNRLVKSLLIHREFPGLKGWKLERSEPRFGSGRFDFELSRGRDRMLIEIKSISLVENGVALFPDAPTERGRRHLLELAKASKSYRTMVIFIVTRGDAISMKPNRQRDPLFAETLERVAQKGVEAVAYNCRVTLKGIRLNKKIPISLDS
jgi:sugar fermentation stimulation protein A